jgi:RND superfamily putative drug exporter
VALRRSRGRSEAARDREEEARPPITLRHPRRALAVAFVLVAVLVAFGFSLEGRLSPSTLDIKGTSTARSNQLLREHFGNTALFAILLQGPRQAIDRQGPELVRTLREDPKVTTLSPWDRGSVARLRPGPRRALILADFHVGTDEAVKDKVPLLNRTLEEEIRPPLKATQSGFATLSRSVEDESITASERGELIALPILLIVLLLVFRSPVAAAVPLGFGAIAVSTSRGLLSILTHLFGVSALALTVCTMMGLALGVDYALLLVSRFREELATGATPVDAAWATRRTAGRTTVFAGSTLVISMVVALFIVPGALLASLAGTVALVVALTVMVAAYIGPPVLVLLGPNIDRWRIGPAPNGERSRLMTVVSAALRRPATVAALIGAVVLLLATPALALKLGPFSIGQLPHDDPAREDAELIGKSIGAGFEAPYVVIAAAKDGTITETQRLDALGRWQHRIAAIPGVQSVIGPGQVSKAVKPLQKTGSAILATNQNVGPLSNLTRLGRDLGRAAAGVAELRGGISQATYGAGLLAQGSESAEEGALLLASGLGQATAGSQEAVAAVDKFAEGTHKLAQAQRRATVAALALKLNLPSVRSNLRVNGLLHSRRIRDRTRSDANTRLPKLQDAAGVAEEQLKAALQQLEGMTTGKSDPNYDASLDAVRRAAAAVSGTDPSSGAPFAPEYAGLPSELATLRENLLADEKDAIEVSRWINSTGKQIGEMAKIAKRLSNGLDKIAAGGNKLDKGATEFNVEAAKLASGLSRLGSGATRLAAGLTRLTGGTSELERGLAEAYDRSLPLQTALGTVTVRVVSQSARLNRRAARLRHTSPGIFDSGYFVLSALDGTRGQLHERAAEAVDLNRGGQAAAMIVFSRYGFNSPGSIALNEKLEDDAAALGKEANAQTGVAGGTATLNTYSRVTRDRFPYVIVAITIATFLILVLVLRALPLAAIAVGLNLATVGVAFGVLTLLTHVPEGWPLGGRTYVDAVGATMIFGVVFGLSIDYAVFLLVRMRERYDRGADNATAIEFGLEKTARVITGAAAIMMAVFIAFAGAPIATVSQLGIGLTIAVLLDATVVRIVLLPALMLLIGERVWWLPRPLARALPRLNV